MATSVNGTAGITFNDGSVLGSQLGIFNRIIDGGFTINQRGYVSGTSLASGTYGHDRWKGGASAGTYTFTQGALGVNTTITITAGSIIQVIEGCNLPEGGTYVLSWTGTAQGRLNGGSYGSSGTVTVTGWTAGTNLNVEFNTGTLGNVQLVAGSAVSSYAYRPYGTELALCQRYYQRSTSGGSNYCHLSNWGSNVSTTTVRCTYPLKTSLRAAPSSVDFSNLCVDDNATAPAVTGLAIYNTAAENAVALQATVASGLTTFRPAIIANVSGVGYIGISAEL